MASSSRVPLSKHFESLLIYLCCSSRVCCRFVVRYQNEEHKFEWESRDDDSFLIYNLDLMPLKHLFHPIRHVPSSNLDHSLIRRESRDCRCHHNRCIISTINHLGSVVLGILMVISTSNSYSIDGIIVLIVA